MPRTVTKETADRKHTEAFIGHIFNKNYAQANEQLVQAVKEKLTQRVDQVLKEIK